MCIVSLKMSRKVETLKDLEIILKNMTRALENNGKLVVRHQANIADLTARLTQAETSLTKTIATIHSMALRDNKKVTEAVLKKHLPQKLPPELIGEILQQGVLQKRKKVNSVKKSRRSISKRRASRRR